MHYRLALRQGALAWTMPGMDFVKTDPEIMGGLPCFSGTRVPIENVLGSLDEGVSWERVLASYPFLSEAHVEAARAYVQTHPLPVRGRRFGELHPESVLKSSGVVSRPKTTE
jgi:uncharacterized protein (DUF433 family)